MNYEINNSIIDEKNNEKIIDNNIINQNITK
jgi:hypothetical protein